VRKRIKAPAAIGPVSAALVKLGMITHAQAAEAERTAAAQRQRARTDDDVVTARFKLDTDNDCWAAACWLFDEIKKRHGDTVTKKMFATLASPDAKFRRRLRDAEFCAAVEMAAKEGWTVQKLARQWAGNYKTSEDALRNAILRALRKRRGKA
jgi:hypothetical protein